MVPFMLSFKDTCADTRRVTKQRMSLYRRLSATAAILLIALCMPYANASDSGSPDRAAAERAVDNALKSLSEGYRTLNPRLLTSPAVYYSDDSSPSRYVLFDVMPPFVDVGFNTLLEKNTKYVDIIDGPIVVSWTDTYVDGDSGFAYFRGIMHAKASYKDGRKLDIALRHTLVFKKIDGKFLIVHEHASVPDAAIGIETPSKQ